MRLFIPLLTLCISTISYGQINVNVSGNIFNTDQDSVYISQFFGTYYVNHLGTKMMDDGTFEFNGKLPNPDYYVLKIGDSHVNLILREGSDIKVYGDGAQLSKFVNIIGSEESANMNGYIQAVNEWQAKSEAAVKAIQEDPSRKDEINREMQGEYQRFQGVQKSFIANNQNSAALMAIVNSIDINNDFNSYESVVRQLNTSFGESPTVKELVAKYETLKKEKFANDPLAPGKMAPDFEEMKPDSTMMKLSDLKGKVVLLDFWASWCGPCRRENPNVVNLYNQYKDDGFTVMSVSLDKSRDAWLAAIEKDNLSWPNHVSDLKYWSSEPAKLYGVHGIPFTVLIDAEGKIIRTKLRGEDLHRELQRIYGH